MTNMNTLGSTGISDYQSRTVTISVTGVCQQSVLKTGNYQVRVPFSQMSQAMKTINHQGGKVTSVQVMGNPPVVADAVDNAERDTETEGATANQKAPSKKKEARRKRR